MKSCSAILFFAIVTSAGAQTADIIFRRACCPKEASFDVQVVNEQPPATPEPGRALVYFIQKESGPYFTTRVGLDGAWVGVIQHDSYIFASVVPGEHHACVASQDRKHPQAELRHFTAEAGKTYYYLVRGIAGTVTNGSFYTMVFTPMDRDEALYLIASDPKSVATQKP